MAIPEYKDDGFEDEDLTSEFSRRYLKDIGGLEPAEIIKLAAAFGAFGQLVVQRTVKQYILDGWPISDAPTQAGDTAANVFDRLVTMVAQLVHIDPHSPEGEYIIEQGEAAGGEIFEQITREQVSGTSETPINIL